MSMASERMAAIKTAAKGNPLPIKDDMMVNGFDLTIPAFLIRKGKRLTHEEAKNLADPKRRDWAPRRKASEIPPKPAMPILTKDPSLPVRVQVKDPKKAGSTFLAQYNDFAAFEAEHDFKNYPLKGTSIFEGRTIALVTAKFWVGKAAIKESSEKKPSRSKTDIIAALLLRPEGCLTSEVLEACSWPAVSMPAQAKLAGLKLRKEKQGKVTRYWGSK